MSEDVLLLVLQCGWMGARQHRDPNHPDLLQKSERRELVLVRLRRPVIRRAHLRAQRMARRMTGRRSRTTTKQPITISQALLFRFLRAPIKSIKAHLPTNSQIDPKKRMNVKTSVQAGSLFVTRRELTFREVCRQPTYTRFAPRIGGRARSRKSVWC